MLTKSSAHLTIWAFPPTWLPAPPSAQPASGSWHLSSIDRGQWPCGHPFPPRGSWAPLCSHSVPGKGSVSAKSENPGSPPAPSEAGTFPPWLLPKPQTQVLLSSRRGLDLAFPRTLESTFFLGRWGEEDVGRAARGQEHLLRVFSELGALHGGLYAQQPLGQLQSRPLLVAPTKRGVWAELAVLPPVLPPIFPFPCPQ